MAAAWAEARAKARVSSTVSAMAVATAAARVAGAGVGDSGGDGCSKRGRYPALRMALDALARLPAYDDDDEKFANVSGGRGRWGRWPGDRRRDDHRSAICPCCDLLENK